MRDANFSAWIARIARNEAVTWLRRNRRRPTVEVADHHSSVDPEDLEGPEKDPRAVVLAEAMQQLRQNYREILLLKYEAQCDYNGITETLDISVANVEKRLYRARLALQKIIDKLIAQQSKVNSESGTE